MGERTHACDGEGALLGSFKTILIFWAFSMPSLTQDFFFLLLVAENLSLRGLRQKKKE